MKRTDGASGSDGGSHKSTIIEQRRSYESPHTYCGRQNCSTLYFGANGYVLGADSLALMRRCAVSMTNIRYVLFDTIFFGHFEEFMVSNDCRPCNTDTYVCASWSTAHCTGTQTQQLIALPPERRRINAADDNSNNKTSLSILLRCYYIPFRCVWKFMCLAQNERKYPPERTRRVEESKKKGNL